MTHTEEAYLIERADGSGLFLAKEHGWRWTTDKALAFASVTYRHAEAAAIGTGLPATQFKIKLQNYEVVAR